MAATAWPYAVTRGENSGYQAIVVPGFLDDAGQAYVLEYASRQETDDPGYVTVRDVLGAAAGPLSLAYRVTQARADRYGLGDDTLLEDGAGRAIRVFEGLALRLPADKVPSLGLTAADLDAVAEATVPAFRKLWMAGTRIDAEPSAAIAVGGSGPGLRPLHMQIAEPYVVPGGREPGRTVVRGALRTDRETVPVPQPSDGRPAELRRPPRSRLVAGVVVGLLAALLIWYLTRSSPTQTVRSAVETTCADLKSGNASAVYREFSSGYQHSTDFAAFDSRLLGSNASATCTFTSTTGDQAVLSLRRADGTTRTVEMDFQSESGQERITAMTVSP